MNKERLIEFDYFRGLAILIIVAGHSFGAWAIDSYPERFLASLISGGTILFVFVSGFFFHYIFYENFNYNKFLMKKLKSVFLPYLFLSTLGILFYLSASKELPYKEALALKNPEMFVDYFLIFVKYTFTGRVVTSYWYIPFITIIFLLSPLFINYINYSNKKRLVILFLLLIFSMFIRRPLDNLSPMHSVFYFISIYLLGINASINAERLAVFLNGKLIALGLMTLGVAIFQTYLFDNFEASKNLIYELKNIDISLIQKIFMCAFFLGIFIKIKNYELKWLRYIAAMSFSIFFLHPWVGFFYVEYIPKAWISDIPGFFTFIIRFFVVILLSMMIAYIVKSIIGRRSLYFIGW